MNTDLYDHFRLEFKHRAEDLAKAYQNADPFPHVVIDDFLPPDVANRILDLFPSPDDPDFKQPAAATHQTRKLGRLQDSHFAGVDPWLRTTLFHFNSLAFLDALEALTGVPGLIPDPHFRGGAFHQVLPGGKLDVHADFNTDQRRLLRRRVNVLVYLNHDWKPEYQGYLELWNQEMTMPVVRISPDFNRCVVFSTSSTSFHGHPEALAAPRGVTRKSLAVYYYASDPSVFLAGTSHETLWQQPRGASST